MKQIFMWFTPKCTLKCNHCSIGSTNSIAAPLNVTQRKQAIDKLKKWPGPEATINFVGGEPFLIPSILDLVSHAHSLGFKTTLTTNAINMTPKLVQEVCDSGLSHLSFSLDSAAPETHDRIRGKHGCYHHAVEIIDLFMKIQRRPKIYLNTLIQAENSSEISRLVDLSILRKLDGITFQPIAPPAIFTPPKGQSIINKIKSRLNIPLSWGKNKHLWPDPDQIIPELEKIIQLKKNGAPIVNTLQDLQDFILYFSHPAQYLKEKKCTACNSISIMPDGSLKLCPSGKTLGNIFKDDLDKCYSSSLSQKEKEIICNCCHPCLVLSLFKDDYYF